jgi:hypothetical protein
MTHISRPLEQTRKNKNKITMETKRRNLQQKRRINFLDKHTLITFSSPKEIINEKGKMHPH